MRYDCDHGDRVEVKTSGKTYVGTHLPRPELLEKEVFVLKMDTGYNIGIDKKKIKDVKILEKYRKPAVKLKPISKKKGLLNVSVVSSGGTISSKIDYKTGGVIADYTAEDFVEMAPELKDIANLKAVKSMGIMSEDMNDVNWVKVAKDIQKELNNGADGVVLTMGTDTLHYMAAALSFFFHDIRKPIIITAAQRSIDRGSSDAFMNLICSVNAAANFDGSGVYVCMHGSSDDEYCNLIRGTKVRKMHTSRRDAFRPINSRAVAKVYLDKEIIVEDSDYPKKDIKSKTGLHAHFDEKVGFLQITPLIDPKIIDFYIKNKYKGLIINATALGHVPTSGKNEMVSALKRAKDAGMSLVVTSQTIYGRTNPYVYSNLRRLSLGIGVLYAKDMPSETALVKLGWILGKTKDEKEIEEMFNHNYAQEYNDTLTEDEFLN